MAGVYTKTQVRGLEETLRELRKIEPQYVKDFRKRARMNAADAVKSAKEELLHQRKGWRDTDYPLPNMAKGPMDPKRGPGFRFNFRKVRAGIKFKLGGPRKNQRTRRTYRMFSIAQMDGPGAMYDMAGRRNSNPQKVFENVLEDRVDIPHRRAEPGRPTRGPSRYMYPGVWFFLPQLEDRMVELVRELERKTNRKLIRGRRK